MASINHGSAPRKEDDAASSSSSTGNRKFTSDVWKFYDYIPPSTAGGKDDKAICKLCGSILSASSSNGTSHLWRHVKSNMVCMKAITELYDDLEADGLVDI